MLGMSLTMSHSQTQVQAQVQRQRLTIEQRHEIKMQQVAMRLELVSSLRNERYKPKASCPDCGHDLTPTEILAGFTDDIKDFTTGCPRCDHRFAPSLICFGEASQIEIPFYCGVQAQDLLSKVSDLSPEEIARKYPGEYRSAVVHYGTLQAMFAELGVDYNTYQELEGWQAKIQPFLGRMPDTKIAECVGASAKTVSKLRRNRGIPKFTKRSLVE